MGVDFVDAALLKRLFVAATNHLEENKAVVDALNVFPVPDGDTGTNMTMTMLSASREVQKAPESTVAEVAEACAMGSLMGARGNSGVILSQLFRGFAKGLEGKQTAGASDFAWALQEGVRTAYKAVMKPVEGTILTVARESAKAALAAARQNEDVLGLVEAAHREAEATLARTPDMLPILKKAGVVDSGGKGFTFVLEGYLEALRGAALDAGDRAAPVAVGKDASPAGAVQFDLHEEYDIRFPYDIELMIKGQGLLLDDIRNALAPMGDSLLVVGTAELAKVHIHAGNPGPVLDHCVRAGTVFNIEIKNMQVQHEDIRLRAGLEATAPSGAQRLDPKEGLQDADLDALVVTGPAAEAREEAPELAVVAVAAGDGIVEIFRSLGVAAVIEGGQTMNPSTEDLLRAARETRARNVIVLPNNRNIILAAQQARELADGQAMYVIPTRSFPEGIAAMLAWQPEGDAARLAAEMERAGKAIRTGEVTFSVRDTAIGDLQIQKGDVLGLAGGQIVTTGSSAEQVAADVVDRLMEDGGEIITLYYGEGVTAEQAGGLAERLRGLHPDAEVEVHNGGQPLYYYLISVE